MGKICITVDYTDNYVAYPANDDIACITTGRTLNEAKANMEESLHWHIDSMREDGEEVPVEFDGEWELEWNLTTRAVLHYTERLVSKAALAKATGINQNQLTHYANGYRKPRPAMRQKIVAGLHSIAEQLSAIS